MPRVTVRFSDDEITAIDRRARAYHDGDREAVVGELLDQWLEAR